MIDLYKLVDGIDLILEELSYKILEIQTKKNFKVEYKDLENTDPLTTADIYSHNFLKKELSKALPDSYILSEESEDNLKRLKYDWVWVIDPIDGTREFANNQSAYSISIGLLYKNQPVLGAVSMPKEQYMVIGLNINSDPYKPFLLIHYLDKPEKEYLYEFRYEPKKLSEAKILVSNTEYKKSRFKDFPKNWHLEPSGSVARKLAMLSIGKGDLLVSLVPKNEWDICGGIALVYASGQIAFTLEKENHQFKKVVFNKNNLKSIGLVCGNPYLVREYLDFHLKNNISVYEEY